MKAPTVLAVMLLAAPFAFAEAQLGEPLPAPTGERTFVLLMENHRFNLREWPDTPLLEAYAGEEMHFVVHVPITAEPHTFHLHGHPWVDPATGDFIDAILLNPGDTHEFTVTAGLGDGFAGDWFYHCHVETHFGEGMWGILRVYPFGLSATGTLDALTLDAWHADGRPAAVDRVTAAFEGTPVDARATRTATGAFTLDVDVPRGAAGTLVLTADGPLGESVTRLRLDTDGGFTPLRDVGDRAWLADDAPIPDGGDAPTLADSLSRDLVTI